MQRVEIGASFKQGIGERAVASGLRRAGLFLQRGALVGKTYLDVCLVCWGIGGGLERKDDEAARKAQGLCSRFIRLLLLVGFSS